MGAFLPKGSPVGAYQRALDAKSGQDLRQLGTEAWFLAGVRGHRCTQRALGGRQAMGELAEDRFPAEGAQEGLGVSAVGNLDRASSHNLFQPRQGLGLLICHRGVRVAVDL